MFSSSESHVSSSNNVIISPLSNDEELFEDMDEEDLVTFHCMVIACNLHNFFTSHEIAERIVQSHLWDPRVDVQKALATMQSTPHLFNTLIDFTSLWQSLMNW
jgi:hypothetical protein